MASAIPACIRSLFIEKHSFLLCDAQRHNESIALVHRVSASLAVTTLFSPSAVSRAQDSPDTCRQGRFHGGTCPESPKHLDRVNGRQSQFWGDILSDTGQTEHVNLYRFPSRA